MNIEEEIKRIKKEIRNTPYNKATQYHIGKLKAKLARLKTQVEIKSKTKGKGFSTKKSGDATVLLVGFPSVGKSTLINCLTNVESKVADYDFTTLEVIPGMLEYNGANIQILDIPGLISDASKGKGKSKQILSVVRNADLILILIDKPEQSEIVEKELYNAGFRLNQNPPNVIINKKSTGGVSISSVPLTKIDKETVQGVLHEFKIHNADVTIRGDISIDQLIDSILKNRIYIPSLIVLNKIDILDKKELERIKKSIPELFVVSALKGINLENLKEVIWQKLGLIRIYMKKIGKQADFDKPLIIKKGSTIKEVCEKIHKDFLKNFKYARLWGSAKFSGQKVGLDYKLKDEDVIELHIK